MERAHTTRVFQHELQKEDTQGAVSEEEKEVAESEMATIDQIRELMDARLGLLATKVSVIVLCN